MAKQPMQDIVPAGKRSIRRINIDRVKRTHPRAAASQEREESPTTKMDGVKPPVPPHPPVNTHDLSASARKSSGRRIGLWLLLGALALVLLFIIGSYAFAGARIEVIPKEAIATIDTTFTAQKDDPLLAFETMVIERDVSREITATGEEHVDIKASGKIVIYNNYSSAKQALIKNTRFETPEGLIYRIPESISVPGRTTASDGTITPGSIEVTVFADSAGEAYNIDLADFTIPGFKGDPRYSKFYARSKTPMTGGFSGTRKTVKPDELAAARDAMKQELRATLLSEAFSVKPEGFVLYSDAIFLSFTDSEPVSGSGDTATVTEHGTLNAIIFDRSLLSRRIAELAIGSYAGEPVDVRTIEDLTFVLLNREALAPEALEEVSFAISGSADVVWTFEEEALKDDLAGKLKKGTDIVFSGYPSIAEARIVVRPFWKRYLPEDAEDIDIVEVLATP